MINKLTEKPKQSNKEYLSHLQILDSTIEESSCLSDEAFRVYIILRKHWNRKDGKCNPSVETIRRKANGMSKKRVERGLKELKHLGWIFVKSGHGPNNSNNYTFPVAATTIQKSAADDFNNQTSAEASLDEYLARKQQEFPQHDVVKIYKNFLSKCGSEKYPNMKPTRRKFDQWLESQDELMT